MSDRQEFENDFLPQPFYKIVWEEKTSRYLPVDIEDQEHVSLAHDASLAFSAYQAAHKAQQAEIERLKKRNNELFYTLKWLFEMTDDLDCEDYSRVEKALEGNQ